MHFRTRMKQWIRVVFALSFAAMAAGLNPSPLAQAQTRAEVNLTQFDMLTSGSGWVLLGKQLFSTSDAGQTWNEMGPALSPDASMQDVQFIDARTGWMLWTTTDPGSGSASFYLAQTLDGGNTWTTRSLSLFELGETGSYVEKAEMGWFDLQTGWISVKQISGSNFSLGILFTTSDGGTSWHRSVLPVADNIVFSDPQTGWAIGGPAGDGIFTMQDAGSTWTDVKPSDLSGFQSMTYPPFVSDGQGLLVVTTQETENALKVYSLKGSRAWSSMGQVRLDVQPGRIGLSILDARNFVATIPGTGSIVRMIDGALEVLKNEDGRSASISELDMISTDIGWARSIDANCASAPLPDDTAVSVSCSSSAHLLQTADGGITWKNINLPSVPSDSISSHAMGASPAGTLSAIPTLENTEVFIGQGFDKCEIPSLSQMQTWWDASPYKAVNLYIGGSSRACANSALTASYLSQLYQQGWKFIPTWVGPQAPCTGYLSRMSSDVTAAFQQGVSEADLAVERLAALGLTNPDKTSSVIYYDIEHYGTNTACRAAVNAFMNGWVSQIQARGNLAGVYGSTLCNTGLSDFLNITYVPDVIWPARWYHNPGQGFYDPTANVWNLGSCLPNTEWSDHQRIRQYEGDHDEFWGGLVLGIDSNVLDGVVAIPTTTPVEVNIAKNPRGTYKLVPQQVRHQSYPNVNNGPVQILNAGDTSLIASERVVYRVNGVDTSFTELMGLPDRQLDNVYWLPWYNNKDLDTQLRFANISASTATVHVSIGGVEMIGSPFMLPAGASTRKSFPGIDRGPVKIESTVNIVAAERVIYKAAGGVNTSFTEMMALPASQLDNIYWLPGYNNIDLDTQLRFANVSGSPATVRVYIGGLEMAGSPFTLAPGASRRLSFVGIDKGPVKIVSTVDIVAAERVIYKVNGTPTSFAEMMGLPDHQLDTTYWLPWYNNIDLDTQLRLANVSATDATVHVTIGGVTMTGSPFTVASGASTRLSFAGIDKGPVKIESTVDIVAAERVILKANGVAASFSEMMALPESQLDTIYWLPWYNNVDLDTQLRFGVP